MVQITKDEAMYLAYDKKFRFGEEIMHDHSGHHHYWCMEGAAVLSALQKYREGKICEHIGDNFPKSRSAKTAK